MPSLPRFVAIHQSIDITNANADLLWKIDQVTCCTPSVVRRDKAAVRIGVPESDFGPKDVVFKWEKRVS